MTVKDWSKFQKAIFDEVENGEGHLVVQARAGCAKTTSLVQSLHYVSSWESWLLCAFNKRIAAELKKRAPDTGEIRTNHSLGLKAIKKRFPNVEVNNDKVWEILNRLVGKDRKWNDIKTQLRKTISLCKANLVDDPKTIDILLDEYDIDVFDMDRDEFVATVNKALLRCFEDTNTVDFDDMIWFPNVFDMKVGNYDRVFIDECVDTETIIKTDQGQKVAKDIQVGEKILSYENGSAVYNTVLGKKESSQNEGLIIRTKNGHVLNMTSNHTLYATRYKDVPKNKLCLYLMYRKDLGFRIGTTKKLKTRARSESADKYWILELGSEEEILFKEQEYSLKYQVPTYVFNATKRGCDQDRVNKIFNVFGENGIRILKDYNYSFKYPHWISNTAAASSKHKRNILYLRAHQRHKTKAPLTSIFRFECYSEDYVNKLNLPNDVKVYKDKHGRQLITGNNVKYSKLKKQAEYLAKILDADLVENITINKNKLYLTNAGALFPGMKVIVHKGGSKNKIKLFDRNLKKIAQDLGFKEGNNGSISYEVYDKIRTLKPELNLPPVDDSSFCLDEIVSIEKSQGSFIDLEVENSSNFFANDILTHNCQDLSPGQVELALKAVSDTGRITAVGDDHQAIYSWAGAGVDTLDKLAKRLNAKVLPLPITYRCPTKIVKHAQQFVPDIEARPNAPEGKLEFISSKDMMKKAKPGCFILSRINAPLIGLALKFIGNGVPCNIQGRDIGANLVTIIKKSRRKTIPAFLSWLEKWERKEIARVTKMNRSPVPIRDKAQCLRTLADACSSVGEMKSKIQDLFEDGDDTSRIILSTVHRAKGLERDIVFVLSGTFFGGNKEERNIKYVSCTRAKSELYFVTGGNYSLKKTKKRTKKST